MGLGGILLGLGAITFVAANWQLWSRTAKVGVLLACFVAVNAAGFYLWRRPPQKGWQHLGQGLLLLGALLLGANMALMSQLFHQTGESYELFLIWGLGVVLMAYSLRLVPLGVLALILVMIGYCLGWASWIWDPGSWQQFSGTQLLVQHLPLLISVVFVPLVYWCRSRVIMGLSAAAIAISLLFNLKPLTLWGGLSLTPGWIVAIAFVLPPALLWSYRDHRWQSRPVATLPSSLDETSLSQPLLQILALWFLAILFYVFAFRGFWTGPDVARSDPLPGWNWAMLIDAGVLGSVALLGWTRSGNPFHWGRFQLRYVYTGTVAIGLIIAAALFIWGRQAAVIAVVGFNLLLFLLALGLIRDGLSLGYRSSFWGGMVLLVLGIISRMLEYDTGLLLKSVVFALCGIGVILAGLRFEHTLRARPLSSLPHSSSEGTP